MRIVVIAGVVALSLLVFVGVWETTTEMLAATDRETLDVEVQTAAAVKDVIVRAVAAGAHATITYPEASTFLHAYEAERLRKAYAQVAGAAGSGTPR